MITINHLLTQDCYVYTTPTLDKFGNPSVWEEKTEVKCRLVESKQFRKDAQNREFESEALLTTRQLLRLNQRVEYAEQSYAVVTCQALRSPHGVLGYTSHLVKYKNFV